MSEGSGSLVFLILILLFMAVGLYLIWYSRRRKKMLDAFAKTHQLRIRPEHEKELQKTLDSCFLLKDKGLVRSFGQLSSLVDGESNWLFRAVELLDLNPHAQSYSTHFSRIVALFDILTDHDEFFVLNKSMQASQKLPRSKSPNPMIIEITKRIAKSCKARHTLSVTLTCGHGLIYFEPLTTGGETISDVSSLYCIAKNMSEKLSGNV
jgi:hypothetical protein